MKEFQNFGQKANNDELFAEVAYCICTPMNPFEGCQSAITKLQENKLLFSGDRDVIAPFLLRNRVRFHNVKAGRITEARAKLYEKGCPNPILGLVKDILSMPQRQARNRLYEIGVPGLGMKESSHFLRNIGHGDDLAILDRHILGKLVEHGVIDQEPKTLTLGSYQSIEEKMTVWSNEIGIPLGELDLLLWSEETGKIFK
ncbi:MAG: DNA lyase [Chloroflexi bacterium]|nr:DNA lyase [Chloroflexota bacterium]